MINHYEIHHNYNVYDKIGTKRSININGLFNRYINISSFDPINFVYNICFFIKSLKLRWVSFDID